MKISKLISQQIRKKDLAYWIQFIANFTQANGTSINEDSSYNLHSA